jgi:hypothetical protein
MGGGTKRTLAANSNLTVKIGAVLLAAGDSRRFGSGNKLLADIGGKQYESALSKPGRAILLFQMI